MYEMLLLKGEPIIRHGTLNFGELAARYQIPHRVTPPKMKATNVLRMARDLHGRRVDLPTAVLECLQSFTRSLTLRDDMFCRRRPISTVFVVDGQHRQLKKVMDEDLTEVGQNSKSQR